MRFGSPSSKWTLTQVCSFFASVEVRRQRCVSIGREMMKSAFSRRNSPCSEPIPGIRVDVGLAQDTSDNPDRDLMPPPA
jgi:hypothetical protein